MRRRSVIDGESPVVDGVCREDLQRGEMKGEVRHTINWVHGTWGCGGSKSVKVIDALVSGGG
jgi:hypothetical protein